MDNNYAEWGRTLSLRPPPPPPSSSPPTSIDLNVTPCPLEVILTPQEEKQSDLSPSAPPPQGRKQEEDDQQEAGKRIVYNDIEPTFPWATSRHATVHSRDHLISIGITKIKGTVKCKKCGVENEVEYDLEGKFRELTHYIRDNIDEMHDRWKEEPRFKNCESCGQEKSLIPVISQNNEEINWLFLLLGRMIGCCNLPQLKYFCKHNNVHRTAAKDRLVYLTYSALCDQLNQKDII